MIENRRFTSLIFHLFTARRLLTRPSHIRLSNAVMSVVSLVANSFFGLVFFSFLYGFLGYVLSILQFIRLGPRRFFHRVARPTPPVRALDPIYGDHSMIKLKSSGVSIHYVSKGLPNQPMILFLHGFPECWYSWRYQMKHFSREYRVVAIDQRGYGLSSKLPFVADYRTDLLAGDVADIIEQLGYESCVLVGHDWGGVVAWTTAMLYPHVVEKLVILNAPHPTAFREEMTLKQLNRSWYVYFNQTPLLPELLVQSDDFALLSEILQKKPNGLINSAQLTDDDIEVYKYTFSQEGTAKAAINYYRALLQYPPGYPQAQIVAPVLLLWGCQDRALGDELADLSGQFCSDIRVKKIVNASHWVNQDVPEMVNKYIDIFLKEVPPTEYNHDF